MRAAQRVILAAAVMIFAATAWASAVQKPAAMIIRTHGKITVQRHGKQKTVQGKFPLKFGDRLVVARDAWALLLYPDGKKFKADADMEITTPPASAASALSVGLDHYGGIGAGVRTMNILSMYAQIISPLNTAVTDPRPEFRWELSQPGAPATLVLFGENGNQIWSVTTTDSSAVLPADVPDLQPGRIYSLELTADLDGFFFTSTSEFNILEPDRAREIMDRAEQILIQNMDDDFSLRMLLARHYADNGLMDRAVQELERLAAAQPDNIIALLELADMYYAAGRENDKNITLLLAAKLAEEQGDPFEF